MCPEDEAHNDIEGTSGQSGDGSMGGSGNTPLERSTSSPQGLAPTDITALPAESRELVTWLARRKTASLEEIEQALDRERDSLIDSLKEMQMKGYVREMRIEGVNYYRVVFHAKPRRGPRGLSKNLWERIDLGGGETAEE